jgi:hypothetical protein
MNYRYYKAASERTDEDERALIPPFEKPLNVVSVLAEPPTTLIGNDGGGEARESTKQFSTNTARSDSRGGVQTPFDEKAEHEHDLEQESKRDYYEVDNNERDTNKDESE